MLRDYKTEKKLFKFYTETKGKLWLSAMVVLSLLITSTSFAQSQSIDIQVSQLEQNYDSHINSILSNYFERESFIVNVTINAEITNEVTGTVRDQIVREPRGNITMPGLPYLPDENIRPEQRIQTETFTRESTARTLLLLNINVNVFADTSYSDQQIEFVNLLTNIAAKTNPNRGDVVEVTRIPIPGFERNFTPDTLPESNEPDLVALFNQYMPGLFLLLIILLFVANRFQGLSGERVSHTQLKKRDDYKNDIHEADQNNSPFQTISIQDHPEPKDSLSEMLDRVMKLFIKSPRDVALLFEYWIDDHPKAGAQKAANVIQTIDKQLLKTLEYDLPNQVYQAIENELITLPPMADTEREEVAEKFLRIFSTHISQNDQNSKYGQLKLFRYLDHMSDDQIDKLLQEEPTVTAAITLDYLPAERAANILENMSSERAAKIMIEITNIPQLSFKEYNTISSQLFSIAIGILKKEKQETEGINNMLPLLQKLPIKDQKRFIEQMNIMGSSVGEAVKSKIIMPEEIPALDELVIKSAIQHIDTQTLLHAVSDFSDEIKESILKYRPHREQKLIRKELERGAPLDSTRITEAELLLMNSIRQKALELNR